MADAAEMIEPCSGCGLAVPDGTRGCDAILHELSARDFEDLRYFRVHRLMIDAYCLQHPDRYCRSAKSLAAHLVSLCLILEHGADAATGSPCLQRLLDGAPQLERPAVPAFRGALTIADVRDADNPDAYAQAVRSWAEAVWRAYAALHPFAHDWAERTLRASSARSGRTVRSGK